MTKPNNANLSFGKNIPYLSHQIVKWGEYLSHSYSKNDRKEIKECIHNLRLLLNKVREK